MQVEEKGPGFCTCGALIEPDNASSRAVSRRGSVAFAVNDERGQPVAAAQTPHVCFPQEAQSSKASRRSSRASSRKSSLAGKNSSPRSTSTRRRSSRLSSSPKRSSTGRSETARRGSSRQGSPTGRARPRRRARSPRRKRAPSSRRGSHSPRRKAPRARRKRSRPTKLSPNLDYNEEDSNWIYRYAFESPARGSSPIKSSPLVPPAGAMVQYQPTLPVQAQPPTVVPIRQPLKVVSLPASPVLKVLGPPRLVHQFSERQLRTSFMPRPDPPGWDSILRLSLAVAGASILILTIMVAVYIIMTSKREATEEDIFAPVTPSWLSIAFP